MQPAKQTFLNGRITIDADTYNGKPTIHDQQMMKPLQKIYRSHEANKEPFGHFSSGRDDLSSTCKQVLKEKLLAKHAVR